MTVVENRETEAAPATSLPADGVPLFSSGEFLGLAAAAVYGHRGKAGIVKHESSVYRVLLAGNEVVNMAREFPVYYEALSGVAASGRAVPYIPLVAEGVVPAAEWRAAPIPGRRVAPLIRFDGFRDQGAVSAFLDHASRAAALRRAERALAAAHGPLEFVYDDPGAEAFERALAWKSAQYQRTGLTDKFLAGAPARRLYDALREGGLLRTSTLRAGERIVAAHLGQAWGGRFYYRLPAYDFELGRFSPGRLLLSRLIGAAYDEGLAEFDFLLGGEPYKWDFATHVRILRTAGRPPLGTRLRWRGDGLLRAHTVMGRPIRAVAVRLGLARPASG